MIALDTTLQQSKSIACPILIEQVCKESVMDETMLMKDLSELNRARLSNVVLLSDGLIDLLKDFLI